MELLEKNTKKLYFKYLFPALGSSVVCSIYSTVDMICVGQYEGAPGSAALSVVMPIWSIILSIGILLGVGGSVNFGILRGKDKREESNEYFTAAVIASLAVTAVVTALLIIFLDELLVFFGADGEILPLARDYAKYIAAAAPAFLLGQVLISFTRNDGAPFVAMLSVVLGGVINIVGDVWFVFGFDMGISGAGLATAIGQCIGFCVLIIYLFTKKCTLRLKRPRGFLKCVNKILLTGFSPFIADLSFGITVIFFNNQIMRLSGETQLAVYGTVANLHILVQALFYGVGQALQPIASQNFGAGKYERVKSALKYALLTAGVMGVCFMTACLATPGEILALYVKVTPELLTVGIPIMRSFSPTFLFMGMGVVGCYYLQSVMKTGKSLVITLLRGVVLTGALVYILPYAFGFDAIWLSLPLSEFISAVFAGVFMKQKINK